LGDPPDRRRLLLLQRGAVKTAAQVPVGGVEQAHSARLGRHPAPGAMLER